MIATLADVRKELSAARRKENKAWRLLNIARMSDSDDLDRLENEWSDLGAAAQGLQDEYDEMKKGS